MTRNPFIYLIILAFVLSGCSDMFSGASDEEVYEDSIGIRQTSLYNEEIVMVGMPEYPTETPGTAGNLDRSFENAPPMIPHTVEGFLPIRANNNICLTCHMPAIAAAVKATPIPRSHFTNYRPEHNWDGETFERSTTANEVVSEDLGDQLYHGRFNCSQCHVPQANITVAIDNEFMPDFRNEESKSSSNFAEIADEGVK